MNPNEMTDPRVVKQENREEAKAKASAAKGAYRRLMADKDFQTFYNYLETCYNSYIESAGESRITKDERDFLLYEAATIHKILLYVKRQTKD